jgi:hypothetical protein
MRNEKKKKKKKKKTSISEQSAPMFHGVLDLIRQHNYEELKREWIFQKKCWGRVNNM